MKMKKSLQIVAFLAIALAAATTTGLLTALSISETALALTPPQAAAEKMNYFIRALNSYNKYLKTSDRQY
jgi:hypothetical protein